MPADAKQNRQNSLEGWISDLACPACQQGLRIEQSRIVCTGCGRAYPIVDGIPVLIAERGKQPEHQPE